MNKFPVVVIDKHGKLDHTFFKAYTVYQGDPPYVERKYKRQLPRVLRPDKQGRVTLSIPGYTYKQKPGVLLEMSNPANWNPNLIAIAKTSGPHTKGAQFIYVAHALGTHFYKIGIAAGVKKRLAGLQTGSPLPLQVAAVSPTRLPNAGDTEHALHSAYARYRIRHEGRGLEWFTFPPPVVKSLIDMVTRGLFETLTYHQDEGCWVVTNTDGLLAGDIQEAMNQLMRHTTLLNRPVTEDLIDHALDHMNRSVSDSERAQIHNWFGAGGLR